MNFEEAKRLYDGLKDMVIELEAIWNSDENLVAGGIEQVEK